MVRKLTCSTVTPTSSGLEIATVATASCSSGINECLGYHMAFILFISTKKEFSLCYDLKVLRDSIPQARPADLLFPIPLAHAVPFPNPWREEMCRAFEWNGYPIALICCASTWYDACMYTVSNLILCASASWRAFSAAAAASVHEHSA